MSDLPAHRFVLAQSWWIASEIARRHPERLILETHPGDGMYDCLELVDPESNGPALVNLNRVGSLHGRTRVASWQDAIAAEDAHDVVRSLEANAGLRRRTPRPATTPRTLTYRTIAQVLASLVDDRHRWDARNGQFHSAEGCEQRAALGQFESVRGALEDRRHDDISATPAYRFWILSCDEDAVAVLDTDGRLHQRGGEPVDLYHLHRAAGSRLTATVGAALGHLLP